MHKSSTLFAMKAKSVTAAVIIFIFLFTQVIGVIPAYAADATGIDGIKFEESFNYSSPTSYGLTRGKPLTVYVGLNGTATENITFTIELVNNSNSVASTSLTINTGATEGSVVFDHDVTKDLTVDQHYDVVITGDFEKTFSNAVEVKSAKVCNVSFDIANAVVGKLPVDADQEVINITDNVTMTFTYTDDTNESNVPFRDSLGGGDVKGFGVNTTFSPATFNDMIDSMFGSSNLNDDRFDDNDCVILLKGSNDMVDYIGDTITMTVEFTPDRVEAGVTADLQFIIQNVDRVPDTAVLTHDGKSLETPQYITEQDSPYQLDLQVLDQLGEPINDGIEAVNWSLYSTSSDFQLQDIDPADDYVKNLVPIDFTAIDKNSNIEIAVTHNGVDYNLEPSYSFRVNSLKAGAYAYFEDYHNSCNVSQGGQVQLPQQFTVSYSNNSSGPALVDIASWEVKTDNSGGKMTYDSETNKVSAAGDTVVDSSLVLTSSYEVFGITQTADYTVTAVVSDSDATIDSLSISDNGRNHALSPEFASGTTTYTLTLDYSDSTISIVPTLTDAEASYVVTYDGVDTNLGSFQAHDGGTICIVVTAANGNDTETYTIDVEERLSGNNNLSNVQFRDPSELDLDPDFNATDTDYTLNVDAGTDSVEVTFDKDDNASVSGVVYSDNTRETVNSTVNFSQSNILNIDDGNLIVITVIAQDGTTKEYTFLVSESAPVNCDLSSLTVTDGSLSPDFSANTLFYTLYIDEGVNSVGIAAVADDSENANVVIKVNGTLQDKNNWGSISVSDNNEITITVTGSDGVTKRTYTLTVALNQQNQQPEFPGALDKNYYLDGFGSELVTISGFVAEDAGDTVNLELEKYIGPDNWVAENDGEISATATVNNVENVEKGFYIEATVTENSMAGIYKIVGTYDSGAKSFSIPFVVTPLADDLIGDITTTPIVTQEQSQIFTVGGADLTSVTGVELYPLRILVGQQTGPEVNPEWNAGNSTFAVSANDCQSIMSSAYVVKLTNASGEIAGLSDIVIFDLDDNEPGQPELHISITDNDNDKVYFQNDALQFNIAGIMIPDGAPKIAVRFYDGEGTLFTDLNLTDSNDYLLGLENQSGSYDFSTTVIGTDVAWPLQIVVGGVNENDNFTAMNPQPIPLVDEDSALPVLLNVLAPDFLNGDTTNFSSLGNMRAVSGLTFEIAGKGKIRFNSEINILANQSEFANLSEAGKLIIETGKIGLNSTDISFLANEGATLTMYGLDYDNVTLDNINHYDDSGNQIADVQIRVSNLSYIPPQQGSDGILSFDVTGFSTYEVSVLSSDASLSTFSIGGESVLGLNGIEVADPQSEAGPILQVADFSGLTGINVVPTDDKANFVVKLNGSLVAEGDLASQNIEHGDVIVIAVTAEDGTIKYYKVTAQQAEAPVISVTGVSEGQFYNNPVTPVISVTGGSITSSTLNGSDYDGSEISNEGQYILEVEAENADNGLTSSSYVTFKIDTTAPVITLNDLPDITDTASMTVTGTYTEANLTSVTVNGITATVDSQAGTFSVTITLNAGDNNISAIAVDKAGNSTTTDVQTVELDTKAPVIALDELSDITGNVSFEVTGTYNEDNLDTITVNGTAATLDSELSTFSATIQLVEGDNTIKATAIDEAGNSSETGTQTVVLDTTDPVITLDALPAITDNADIIVTGTYTEANLTSITVNGTEANANAGIFSVSITLNEEGDNDITATAVDALDHTTTDTKTVKIDTTAPVIALSDLPEITGNADITVTGTYTEANLTSITVNGATADVDSQAGTFSATITLKEGDNSITATAVDAVNHSTMTDAQTVELDTTDPVISVGVIPEFTNSSSYTFTGIYEEINLDKIEISLNSGEYNQVDSAADSLFSKELTLNEGTNTIVVRATDRAGNTASTEVLSIKLDTIDPQLVIEPIDVQGSTANVTATLIEENVNENLIIAKVDENFVQHTYNSGSGEITVSLTGLVDGSHTISISVEDLAGNSGNASKAFTVDTTAPEIIAAITSPADGLPDGNNGYYKTTPVVTLTCLEGLPITYKINGGNEVNYNSVTGVSIPDGTDVVLSYEAEDGAGNTGSGQLTFAKVDTDVPAAPSLTNPPASSASVTQELTGTAEEGCLVSATVNGAEDSKVYADGNGDFSIVVSLPVEGDNSIAIYAIDAAGNRSVGTSHSITRDTRGPDLVIAYDNVTTITVLASEDLQSAPSIDVTDESNEEYNINLEGTNDREYTYSVRQLTGDIKITASASDNQGNQGFGTLTLRQVVPDQNNNIDLGNGNQLTIPNGALNNIGQFTANTPSADQYTIPSGIRFLTSGFQFLIDNGGYSFNQNILASLTVNGGSEGKLFVLTQVDGKWVFFDLGTLSGNEFSFTTSHFSDFGVGEDNQAPVIEFDQVYPVLTNNVGFTVSGNITDNVSLYDASLTVKGQGVSISGIADQADTTGSFSCQPSLQEGENDITVVVTDRFGNSRQYSIKVTLDTSAQLNMSQPGQNQVRTKANSIAVRGTSEAGANITVEFDGVQANSLIAPSDQETTFAVIDLSAKADGSYALNVNAEDPAGNINRKNITVIRDTQAGLRNISAPTLVTSATTQVTGETDDGDTLICKLNGGSNGVSISQNGTDFTIQLSGLQEGSNSVQIISTDDLGNSKSETKIIKYDTHALFTVASKTPGDASLVNGKYYTKGELSYILQVNRASVLSLKNGGNSLDTETATTAKQVTLTGTLSSDGEYTVTVLGTEGGSQLTESYTVVRDMANPVVTLSDTIPTSATSSNVTISGTVSDENPLMNYQILLNGSNSTNGNMSGTSFSDTVNLSSGSNTILVKVWDYAGNVGEAQKIITYSSASSGSSISSGGGVYIPPSATTTETLLEEADLNTADDKELDKALTEKGQAKLSLKGKSEPKAVVTPNVLTTLAKLDKHLTIENKGVKLEFGVQSLATQKITGVVQDANARVELGAREVTAQEQQETLEKAGLGESTGLFEVGGKVVDLTAQITRTTQDGSAVTDKIDSFGEPVAVTINLSDANISPEDVAKLTAVRYEKDAFGNIKPIKLGGTYNPSTKTFTFYTEKFSLYGVVKARELVSIMLGIGKQTSLVNGASKLNDAPPVIVNNRTMVPIRFISENLGAKVDWHGESKTVKIILGDIKLSMVIGQTGPGIDSPPVIINDRTMVPLRYISESFGARVMWHPSTRNVEIVK